MPRYGLDDYTEVADQQSPALSYAPAQRGPAFSSGCSECPFAKSGKPEKPVAGEGPADPAWLAIGEGPGTNERYWGRPFVGSTGKLVDKMLMFIKQPRDRIWLSNVMLCQPPQDATEAVKRQARACCLPRFLDEIKQFPGLPIFAMGAHAAQVMLGDDFSVIEKGGSYNVVDVDGTGPRVVIPSIHPAAILRGGAGGGSGAHAPDLAFWGLMYDANKVKATAEGRNLVLGEEEGVDYDIEFEDAHRAEQLIEKIAWEAYQTKLLAVDTETYVEDEKKYSALQPLNAMLRAIGLSTADYAVSVSWSILTWRAKRRITSLLADPTIRKVMHNRLYDCPVLKRHGMPVSEPCDDTMLMHHSCFPGLAHDLQRVGTQFYCISPWKAEFREGHDTIENLTKYNAKDTLVTAKLVAPLTIAIKKTLSEKTYAIDIEMARIAQLMHEVGAPVSRTVNQEMYEQFSKAMRNAREIIESKANDPTVREKLWDRLAFEQAKRTRKKDTDNFDERKASRLAEIQKRYDKGRWAWSIGSSDHLVAYLRAVGVSLYIKTDKGRTATRKDILEALAHIPEVRAILDFRTNQKMFSTFCASMFDRYKPDGTILRYGYADENDRIHPRWSVNKITGRWGAEDPMAQNWPKADKRVGRPNLRKQVVAPHGRKFVGFDFAQLEARIIALMSGDRFLVDVFANDRDIHSEFARVVWPQFDQLPIDERKKLRDQVKRPEYGAFYGGQVETLWKNIVKDNPKVLLADIARMVAIMSQKASGVGVWHEKLLRAVAIPPHEIRSAVYDRRRCFPLGNADMNDVYNFPVQSTGADIMDTGLVRIMPRLQKYKDAWPILQIHDAAVFECWEDDAEKIKQDVFECFTQEHTNKENGVTIKFPVEPEIGDSWDQV